jgi:Domain of Unknown Function (DUF1259)
MHRTFFLLARTHCFPLTCALLFPFVAWCQGVNPSAIDQIFNRSGQKTGDVYRLGFPDLHVAVHGLAIKPGLALGSWAAFTGTDDNAMVMGDLVLLEDELNPVMDKLRAAGFEITAIHNHLINAKPHVLYMHYMGHGPAAQLATSLKAALSASKTPLEKLAAPVEQAAPPAWVATVQDGLGRKGSFKGAVLSYGIPRSDEITSNGMTIPATAGVAEAMNFQAADSGQVATTGGFRAHRFGGESRAFRIAFPQYRRHRAAQPHAHRAAPLVLHAFLGRWRVRIRRRRNQGRPRSPFG